MSESDGGPAFPKAGLDPWNQAQSVCTGMTLRDYFAAKAMSMRFGSAGSHIGLSEMASKCYAMADAMLAERAK